MAIQFMCSACSQPIEVDDEWASRLVACPYCRKTVTAPAASQLEDLGRFPMASVVPDRVAAVETPRNVIAKVALALAGGLVALLVAVGLILAPHQQELADYTNALFEAEGLAEMSRVPPEFFEAGFPGWYVAAAVLEITGGLVWIATLVCAIIGVRRAAHRRWAVAALVSAGAVPVFVCGGGLAGM